MKRFATALTLAMATLAFSVAAWAPAHADPNPSLVPVGTMLVYRYQNARGDYGKMTVDVTAKNAGTDDIDVTIVLDGVPSSSSGRGSGTMRELPTLFALDVWFPIGTTGSSYHFMGQIKRSTGEGSGKYTVEGTHDWDPWHTVGFYQ